MMPTLKETSRLEGCKDAYRYMNRCAMCKKVMTCTYPEGIQGRADVWRASLLYYGRMHELVEEARREALAELSKLEKITP